MPNSNLTAKKHIAATLWTWFGKKMRLEHPDAVSFEVHTPESDSSVIAANANTRTGVYWSTDYRYFDQYTLKEVLVDHLYGRIQDAETADMLLRMNYDIHVGAILGIWGKILAFCCRSRQRFARHWLFRLER